MLAPVPTAATIVLVFAVGYLIGSVPIANLVAARRGSGDLRELGDGNPGYWNAKEQLGRYGALPVFAGDVAKGALAAAVALGLAADGQWWMGYIGGGAAMVGHAWPLFDGFRGGRSVLTFVGTAIVCTTVPSVLAIVLLAVVWVVSRSFAWAARAAMAALPFVQFAIEGRYRTAATGALMTFIGLRFAQAAASPRRHRPAP
jgi:glycerol-3-phosphate acyltransferase PlsY